MERSFRQRRAPRARVVIPASCRTDTGRTGPVVMTDLTAEGCCLFLQAVPLSVGLKLRVTPANFQPLAGVVRWVARGHAGIEFDKPLYGPVAEHLQALFRAR